MAKPESKQQRRGGRPGRDAGPRMPNLEVDQLLVEGELVVGDDGVEKRVWPTQREVASRFGVSPGLIGMFAKKARCTERRAAFQASTAEPALKAKQAPQTSPVPVPGAVPPPVMVPASTLPGRGVGRPRKGDAPLISYEELDKLLVFGEVVLLPDGTTTTVYPTYRKLAERYGIVPSVIAAYAKSHNCMRRREQAATRVAVRTEEKLIELRADAVAVGEDRLVQMIDDFLLSFERAPDFVWRRPTNFAPTRACSCGSQITSGDPLAGVVRRPVIRRAADRHPPPLSPRNRLDLRSLATQRSGAADSRGRTNSGALKEGRVRSDNPTDVNTLARLKAFILGGADSRAEVRNILSLESLQERYARMVRDQRDVTPAMGGVVEGQAVRVDGVEILARAEDSEDSEGTGRP